MAKARVAVVKVRESAIDRAVREAIDHVGGIDKYVGRGQRVLLKPNLAYPYPPPATTDPRVVQAIVRLCFEAGASAVRVGDSSAYSKKKILGTGEWTNREVIERTGMYRAVEESGAEMVDFDEDEWRPVKIPNGIILREVPIAASVLDADVRINVPAMKTHLETLATLGLKNYHGIIPDQWKVQWHKDEISQKIVDLHKVVRTDLTVMDGLVGMEGLGPRLGGSVKMDLVLASADVVALDCIAAEIMGFGAWEVECTRLAATQGIGVGDLGQIEVLGERVEDVRKQFQRPDVRISGMYPGITVIQGGPCIHCYGRAKIFIEALLAAKLPLNAGIDTLLVGINPRQPELTEVKGKVAFIGDCAIATASNFRYGLGTRAVCVDGCPPIASVHKVINRLIAEAGQKKPG
jgi:uncharacterized protein (DUF362 family)